MEFFCLFSIRGITAPAMLVLLFRDRKRLEVSSRLVTAQQVYFTQSFCIFSRGTLSAFLGFIFCAIRSLLP